MKSDSRVYDSLSIVNPSSGKRKKSITRTTGLSGNILLNLRCRKMHLE
nr:MAG TPA: hypothetical protein [Bacteriophage sp.]